MTSGDFNCAIEASGRRSRAEWHWRLRARRRGFSWTRPVGGMPRLGALTRSIACSSRCPAARGRATERGWRQRAGHDHNGLWDHAWMFLTGSSSARLARESESRAVPQEAADLDAAVCGRPLDGAAPPAGSEREAVRRNCSQMGRLWRPIAVRGRRAHYYTGRYRVARWSLGPGMSISCIASLRYGRWRASTSVAPAG